MRLNTLLQSAGIPTVLSDPEISSLSYDSRLAGAGSLFFALPGAKADGAAFARQASDKGAAAEVGKLIAQRAVAAGVKEVVFDRGGYMYHGRVAALANAAREGGLSF